MIDGAAFLVKSQNVNAPRIGVYGFEQETSWADEYKRILALFDRTLLRQ